MNNTATAAQLAEFDAQLADAAPEFVSDGDERSSWLFELLRKRHIELLSEHGEAETDGTEFQVRIPPRLRDALTGEAPEGERDDLRIRLHFSEPEV